MESEAPIAIRCLSDFGEVCTKSAVVSARSQLDQQQTFSLPHPDLMVVTDRSLLGWGGHLGELEIKGLYSLAKFSSILICWR